MKSKNINFKQEAKKTLRKLQDRQRRVDRKASVSKKKRLREKLRDRKGNSERVNSLVFGLTTNGAQRADSVGTENPKNAVLISLKEHGPMSVRQISKRTDIDRIKVLHILRWAKLPDNNYVTIVRHNEYSEDF